MKIYKTTNRPTRALKSIKCDVCGKDCKGVSTDIFLRFEFSEEYLLLRTICYECYETGKYSEEMNNNYNKQMQEWINENKEEVGK